MLRAPSGCFAYLSYLSFLSTAVSACKPSVPDALVPLGPASPLAKADVCLPDFAGLFERASGAVVNISAAHRLPLPAEAFPKRDRALLRALARSLGSGYFFDDEGHVVTCSSVIQNAEAIEVILADLRHVPARLVASDDVTDLAVLAVDRQAALPKALPVAPVGSLRPGDWVAAFGYPFGLSHSITAGMVGAIRSRDELESAFGLIFSDTSINPGSNGGPLLNTSGQVVGINLVRGDVRDALGLALPIHEALPVLEALKRGEVPRRARLGIAVQFVSVELADSFHLPRAEGALVTRVAPNGPAALAGVQPGDVISALGQRSIPDPEALAEAVRRLPVGRPQTLAIFRRGELLRISITPREGP